jgi:nucleolar protein 58
VKKMRERTNAATINDFSDIAMDTDVEETLKATAETSMGTEISEEDMDNIVRLCDEVRAYVL